MKKISFILIIAIVILASSCQKKLDQLPISSATTATFYAQPSDFIQAVNATYNSLRGYPDRLMELSEVRSDNIYPTNNDVGRDHDPINNFAPNIASNVYVEEAWRANFNVIFKANTVLEQIAKNSSAVGSAALATRLTAEAKFLRAFFYFDLVKYYGKVPLIDHTVSASEAITIGRSTVADVYALIIADLQFAIANLPAGYSGTFPAYGATDVGRATKGAALTLLAKLYLRRHEWQKVVDLTQQVMSLNIYQLYPSYPGLFTEANKWCEENIFSNLKLISFQV